MDRWWLVAVIVTLQTISTSKSSMVNLTNGGYDDIVIAIHPGIPESAELIQKVKDMVNEATHYLFNATQKKLFIRSAKILIPFTWSKQNYTKRRTETYDKADIIIANPYLKYGDDPYTLQYGGCGEPGKYIHLTPNFLLNDTLLSAYGPRGRVFVHEWAHLRWGVFDEYNFEKPFYVSNDSKVEATRCSRDIIGVYIKKTDQCQGGSCNMRACYYDSNGLYEEGCMFVPDKNQFVKQSIMYLQSLPSVFAFCNASNHNIEAPTLQNRMCNLHSTWEIIKNSTDLNSTIPMVNTTIPVPSISLIQFTDRVITLVLDISGSMASFNRNQRLYQAAEIFVMQAIEAGSYVGIVRFSSSSEIATQLIQIKNNQDREKLKSFLPLAATGGTNICSGILTGITVNKGFDGSSHGTEIVLLSDGEDNYDTSLCYPDIYGSGAIIHFITLGPSYTRSLIEVVKNTGGQEFSATDKVDTTSLIDAFTGITFENGDISQQSIQLESKASVLKPGDCLNGSIFIDSSIGNYTFFVVTWQSAVPNIRLEDPTGQIYTAVNFTSDTTSKSSRLEIPGTAERGRWDYNLCNLASEQSIGLIVSSKAADENVPPITVKAHMNTDKNNFPYPMVVYASVSQGLLPVKGVNVTAIIEPVSGAPTVLELLDNGAGADIVKNDGVYSKYFTAFKVDGRHSLSVRVQALKGKSRLTLRQSGAMYVPGYMENGIITLNPSRATVDDDDGLNLGAFVRTASGGAFEVTQAASYQNRDIFKPEKISDLDAKIENGHISLYWTATGDDLDEGQASEYDLRMSSSPKDLRDNFIGSNQVNMTSVTPKLAGSSESYSFVPENVTISNGTIFYFALVAIDDASQRSDISNIAQAALFIPPPPEVYTTPVQSSITNYINQTERATTLVQSSEPTQTPNESTEKLNPSVITAIVCSAAVLICIVICVTVCIIKFCR
ncbi:PREDICTED: epithelial chloride channel protein-like [Nanorana parkeri]|uniref:epithelial chloride channel protein-like n=1 Tax=Nanorana parkeri TaxID=125878 RepID=UPI000854862C|nr:PREDICTED: epithelial chloride channel protein-like [Nanorana parkeri]